jgi:hypothetical protein
MLNAPWKIVRATDTENSEIYGPDDSEDASLSSEGLTVVDKAGKGAWFTPMHNIGTVWYTNTR